MSTAKLISNLIHIIAYMRLPITELVSFFLISFSVEKHLTRDKIIPSREVKTFLGIFNAKVSKYDVDVGFFKKT